MSDFNKIMFSKVSDPTVFESDVLYVLAKDSRSGALAEDLMKSFNDAKKIMISVMNGDQPSEVLAERAQEWLKSIQGDQCTVFCENCDKVQRGIAKLGGTICEVCRHLIPEQK